jgi:hypothetical protein
VYFLRAYFYVPQGGAAFSGVFEALEELLFVNKKKQKNFAPLGLGIWLGRCHTHRPEEQKFFGSFFQKRTAYLPGSVSRSAKSRNFSTSTMPIRHTIYRLGPGQRGGLKRQKEAVHDECRYRGLRQIRLHPGQ